MKNNKILKNSAFILLFIVGLVVGMATGRTRIELFFMLIALAVIAVTIFMDYQRANYIVALFLILDFLARDVLNIRFLPNVWDELLFIAVAIVWFYKNFIVRKDILKKVSPVHVVMICFIAIFSVIAFMFTDNILISLQGLRVYIQYVFWFFLTYSLIRTEDGARKILYILVLIGLFLSIDGIRQYLMGTEMLGQWVDKSEDVALTTRVYSIIGSPNILGSFMVLMIPITISLCCFEKKKGKIAFFAITAILMFVCLLLTYCRAAWISLFVAFIAYVFIKNKKLVFPTIVLILAGGFLLAFFSPTIFSRITNIFSPEYYISSGRYGRIARWITGLEMLRDSGWVGVGCGSFGGATAANYNLADTFYMDNYYLKVAVEMGIAGLITFVVLIYNYLICCVRGVRKITSKYKELVFGIFAGSVGIAAHCFTENIFEVPFMTVYFWVVAAVAMFIIFGNKENKGNKKTDD